MTDPAAPAVVRFKLRPHQLEIEKHAAERWQSWVMHRRAGKSWYAVAKLFRAAVNDRRPDARFHYIGPSFKQAKAIAFDYLRTFSMAVPGAKANIAELSVKYPRGASIQLLGVENADSLRGRYSDGCVMDEAQLMPQAVWGYVVRPMLADRKGWGFVSGTPAGRGNLLGWARDMVESGVWAGGLFTHEMTDALDAEELADMRSQMSEEAWEQEMLCSFDAALQGAYYASQMADLSARGRIGDVPYDPSAPVFAAMDLGWRDATCIWYAQRVGAALHVIGFDRFTQTTIPEIVRVMREKPYAVANVIVPHDAQQHDLGTGATRVEVMQAHGLKVNVARKVSRQDGIEAVRLLLPRCRFDQAATAEGLVHLRSYRGEFDETKGVMSKEPIHDVYSDGADAFRYLAVGLEVAAGQADDAEVAELRKRLHGRAR